MSETRIPQISDEARERVKDIVKYHYGFTPKDDDIDRIDRMLRNDYVVSHQQRLISELADKNMSNELIKYRDRIGSIEFERIWLEKDIFRYLKFASMCFRAGIPAGTISLCRTAIESGLREKLAEKRAIKRSADASLLAEATLGEIKKLEGKELRQLIQAAEAEVIITEKEIEDIFKKLKFRGDARRILDKFIHGNIVWMVNFARDRKDIKVIGAEGKVERYKLEPNEDGGYEKVFEGEEKYKVCVDKLQEYKIIHEMEIGEVASEVLKATYRIAEVLYYENVEKETTP